MLHFKEAVSSVLKKAKLSFPATKSKEENPEYVL
jgi:hypothetical protein